MILYHLDKSKYKDVWPPEGTLYADGRWNSAGQWVIYTSPTISLAKLEILANENNLPVERVCMTIEVPDTVKIYNVDLSKLPSNWMDSPYPNELVEITAEFLNSGKMIMSVPSAQSMREVNYILNVRHPEFYSIIKLLDVKLEPFDYRLKTKSR